MKGPEVTTGISACIGQLDRVGSDLRSIVTCYVDYLSHTMGEWPKNSPLNSV